VPIGERDQLFGAVGTHADHHQQADLVLLQADLEVDPVAMVVIRPPDGYALYDVQYLNPFSRLAAIGLKALRGATITRLALPVKPLTEQRCDGLARPHPKGSL
jgi:hypothetical protein